METHLQQLCSHALRSLCPHRLSEEARINLQAIGADALVPLLEKFNGFMAFDDALIVLPAGSKGSGHAELDIFTWNELPQWKGLFSIDFSDFFFFAMDLFGYQFGINTLTKKIVRFDPEDGSIKIIAEDLNHWCGLVLADIDFQTGRLLAKQWNAVASMPFGLNRLVPKTFFILGGKFELSNLRACPMAEAMKIRAPIANQIAGLPDGAQLTFRIE